MGEYPKNTVMYEDTGHTFLMKSAEAQSVLYDISSSALHRVWPHMDTLVLPGNTRLHPYPYTAVLGPVLLRSYDRVEMAAAAEEFSHTSEAIDLIEEERTFFFDSLENATTNDEIHLYKLTDLLNIHPQTVHQWRKQNLVKMIKRGREPYITASSIPCRWHGPVGVSLPPTIPGRAGE